MNSKVKYLIAVFIYGTIGMIVRSICFPSEVIALVRGIIGSLFIYLYCRCRKIKIDLKAIRTNLKPLICSGISLGLNWLFLFLAYTKTTVAVGSLCNYMAPIFVIILTVLTGKSKPTVLKSSCVIGALVGVFLISGGLSVDLASLNLTGVILALLAALGFVGLIIFNKQIHDISCYDKSIVQLAVSALTILPYVIINNWNKPMSFDTTSLILVLLLGLFHTGVAYLFYFDSMPFLDVETIAILGYLEPAISVLSSVFVLNEPMDLYGWIGTVLILGCALLSELPNRKKENQ